VKVGEPKRPEVKVEEAPEPKLKPRDQKFFQKLNTVELKQQRHYSTPQPKAGGLFYGSKQVEESDALQTIYDNAETDFMSNFLQEKPCHDGLFENQTEFCFMKELGEDRGGFSPELELNITANQDHYFSVESSCEHNKSRAFGESPNDSSIETVPMQAHQQQHTLLRNKRSSFMIRDFDRQVNQQEEVPFGQPWFGTQRNQQQ
jgi:hypothetical protein